MSRGMEGEDKGEDEGVFGCLCHVQPFVLSRLLRLELRSSLLRTVDPGTTKGFVNIYLQ